VVVDDRDLVERQLDRVIIKPQAIEIYLASNMERLEGMSADTGDDCQAGDLPRTTITVPWSAVAFVEVKGILHSPSPAPNYKARHARRAAQRGCQGSKLDQ
jgi:hypothetical protein